MTAEKTKDEVDNTSGMDLPWLNERQHRRHVKQNYTNTKSSQSKHKETKTVKVSDFDMPFGSMVVFMVKWAIASIPAILILMVLFAIFGGFFVGIISMFNWIDLYIVLGKGNLEKGWTVRVYYNPLVIWIWIVALMIFLGGILLTINNLKKIKD